MNNRECVPEPIAWATHHEPPMLFPTEEEAARYCGDDEHAIPLYALTTPAMLNGVDGLVAMLTASWSKSGIEESRKDQWWAGYDAGRRGCAIDLQSAMLSCAAVTDRSHLEGVTDDAVELATKAIFEDQCPLDSWDSPMNEDERESWRECGRAALTAAYPALMRDAERLDSGVIMTQERDEWGNHKCIRSGLNLRAAIDEAMQESKS